MGIDIHVLNFLVATDAIHKRSFGRTLLLGRQGFHIATLQDRAQAESILRVCDSKARVDDIQPPGQPWAEGLFQWLGSTVVNAMDASDFEGADIIHDLNQRIPDHLGGTFDTIFDGGTIEHIFDFPLVVQNVRAMLAPGGVFISVSGANNQLGHGLYQFSPELMWRTFSAENGFSVEGMYLMPQGGVPTLEEARDPRVVGHRIETGCTASPTYLCLVARRTQSDYGALAVYQSDYAKAWHHNARPSTHVHSVDNCSNDLFSANALLGVWSELKLAVANSLEDSRHEHTFIEKFFRDVGQNRQHLLSFIQRSQAAFETSFFGAMRPRDAVPPFTHKIWLTAPNGGCLPPADFIDNYLASIMTLPTDLVHFFWTNSDLVRRQLRSAAGSSVCVMDISLFQTDSLFVTVVSLLEKHKFVLAADVLKILILYRFGGIYSDLGILFHAPLVHLVRAAEYSFFLGDNLFFQTNFIACAPRSDLMAMFLAILSCPASFDRSFALESPTVSAIDEVQIFAGPGLTVCTMLFLAPDTPIVTLSSKSGHIQWRAQQSWYGHTPKFGNVLVTQSPPTIIQLEDFDRGDALCASHMRIYGNMPTLRAQLRALLLAQPFFMRHSTRFCHAFYRRGSDKAQGWHNYGYVYNYIFGPLANNVRSILEVGIGSNNPDVPSNMGKAGVPGASLRAWRELFPSAQITGADIDRGVLFLEPGIRTFFVDQTDAATVRQLFGDLGGHRFDLIIDDGLHTFEANRTFLEGAYPHLTSRRGRLFYLRPALTLRFCGCPIPRTPEITAYCLSGVVAA
jgi:hypothetical protein